MQMNLTEFRLCPKCGYAPFLENYPYSNASMCGRCNCKIIKISLMEMRIDKILEQNCPQCGAEGEEDDTLFDNGSVIVFKCKKCGTIDGYLIAEEPDDSEYDIDGPSDSSYGRKTRKIAKEEGTMNIPSADRCKAFAKALKKQEKDPKEQIKKQLWQLKRNKTPELQKIKVTEQTIEDATALVQKYLIRKETVTQKQITIFFAASIFLSEERQLSKGVISTSRATERNIAGIFNVDRKTLRKWRNILKGC